HISGLICTGKGEHERGRGFLERALERVRRRSDSYAEARVLASLAASHAAVGDDRRAIELYDRARRYFEQHWRPLELSRCLTGLAALLARAGEAVVAHELSLRAAEEAAAARDPLATAQALLVRAEVHTAARNLHRAQQL